MAKYNPNKNTKTASPKYPSEFGSHASMLVADGVYGDLNDANGEIVYCEDVRGVYATKRVILDNGLSDFNRWISVEERELNLK